MNYNEPDFQSLLPANYDYWCKADVWTIRRGIFLLIGVEDVSISIHRDYDELNCIKVSDVWNMIGIAESSLEAGVLIPHKLNPDEPLESTVLPSVFIAWARLKGYSIPEQLEKIDLAVQVETMSNQTHISKELAILNQAAYKFWANADKDDKDTHLKQEIVEEWLKSQKFSNQKAVVGASIIRPKWAAIGRRPKE